MLNAHFVAVAVWVPLSKQSQRRINLQLLPIQIQLIGWLRTGDVSAIICNGIKTAIAGFLEA